MYRIQLQEWNAVEEQPCSLNLVQLLHCLHYIIMGCGQVVQRRYDDRSPGHQERVTDKGKSFISLGSKGLAGSMKWPKMYQPMERLRCDSVSVNHRATGLSLDFCCKQKIITMVTIFRYRHLEPSECFHTLGVRAWTEVFGCLEYTRKSSLSLDGRLSVISFWAPTFLPPCQRYTLTS